MLSVARVLGGHVEAGQRREQLPRADSRAVPVLPLASIEAPLVEILLQLAAAVLVPFDASRRPRTPFRLLPHVGVPREHGS